MAIVSCVCELSLIKCTEKFKAMCDKCNFEGKTFHVLLPGYPSRKNMASWSVVYCKVILFSTLISQAKNCCFNYLECRQYGGLLIAVGRGQGCAIGDWNPPKMSQILLGLHMKQQKHLLLDKHLIELPFL